MAPAPPGGRGPPGRSGAAARRAAPRAAAPPARGSAAPSGAPPRGEQARKLRVYPQARHLLFRLPLGFFRIGFGLLRLLRFCLYRVLLSVGPSGVRFCSPRKERASGHDGSRRSDRNRSQNALEQPASRCSVRSTERRMAFLAVCRPRERGQAPPAAALAEGDPKQTPKPNPKPNRKQTPEVQLFRCHSVTDQERGSIA